MNESKGGGIQIRSVINAVLGELVDLHGVKPVAIVAAYPAHFPELVGDAASFQEALKGLLINLLRTTVRDEIRIRTQIAPAGQGPLSESSFVPTGKAFESPWGVISLSDVAGDFLPVNTLPPQEEGLTELDPSLDTWRGGIERMGGICWVENQEPASQTIWLALPVKATAGTSTDVSSVREAVGTQLAEGEAHGKSIQLWTVDDTLSEQLAQELVSAGYHVASCQSAAELLPMARRDLPDLMILDLEAREPSAFDLARLIKSDPALARIPLLFLATIADPERGFKLDTAGFIIRSEGTGAMLATIHSVLSSGIPPSARVMVVEPDEVIREQMILHLQASGHPVVEAGSAAEALALVERTRIGVVMANAALAQARDYWLIREIKGIAPELKIFVVSDSLSDEAGKQAIQRGATGFGDTGRLPELLQELEEKEQGSPHNS